MGDLLDVEHLARAIRERRDRAGGQRFHHPMRRQNHQAGIVARHQRHHRVVVRLRLARRTLVAPGAAIVQRGFVAMMSVGDQDARRLELALNDRDFAGRLDRPQLVADSQVVDQIDQRRARGHLLAQTVELGMRAGIEPEDRARVDPQRGQQAQAVLLRGRESSLMRHDTPAIEFLETHSRDKSRAMQLPPLDVESLRVLENCGTHRPLDDARRQPFRERCFRCGVAVRLAPEFEPHDVVRAALVQLILTLRADQIVRRRHHARRLAGDLAVVHERAKRLDAFAEPAHFSASAASAAAI